MTLLPELERAVVDAAERREAARTAAAARRPPATSASAPPLTSDGAVRPVRLPWWRRRLALAAAGVLAASALLIALVGLPQRPRLDLAEEARAALAPRDRILYLALETSTRTTLDGKETRSVGQAALTQHVEEWSTSEPRRYRLVVHASEQRSRWNKAAHLQPHTEIAWADGAQSTYDGDHRAMHTTTGFKSNSQASRSLALPASAPVALEDIRQMLADGRLTEQGSVALDGRTAVRLSGTPLDPPGVHLDYDVDPTTFEPRRIVIRRASTFGSKQPARMLNTFTTIVRRYEVLPRTPANERLLAIHPPAGTKITVQTLEQVRAAIKAKTARESAEGRRRAQEDGRAAPTPRP